MIQVARHNPYLPSNSSGHWWYFIATSLRIDLVVLNDLFVRYYESNECAKPDAEHSGSAAVARGNAYVARTISVDKCVSIVEPLRKEPPAPIYYPARRKDRLYLCCIEQVWNEGKRYIRNQ